MLTYVSTLKAGMIWSQAGFYFITCIFQISGLVSLWTLIVLSLELFIRIMFSLKYFTLSKVTTFRGILFYIWLISVSPYITIELAVAAYTMSANKSLFGPRQANLVFYRLCEQRRFRRACASAQSRQNLRCSLIQAVSQEEPSDRKPVP